MFKISHEVPLELLETSNKFNDYDYALVHLFDKYPEYYEFYKKQVGRGRMVILDNSAYELGQPYDWKDYVKYILNLRPTEYVLPDYRDDAERNLAAAKKFLKLYAPSAVGYHPTTIGVVHGKDYASFVQNYKDLSEFVDKIAFSFESFFIEIAKTNGYTLAEARVNIILKMKEDGIIDEEMPHHILGALSPTEYANYRHFDWIESADTSNPILHGMIGQRYKGVEGLKEKSSIKMESLMEAHLSSEVLEDIKYNVGWFRSVARGNFKPEPEVIDTAASVKAVANSMVDLLEYKNAKYGDAVLNPLNIFQGKCKAGQRLDDKLGRIKNSDELRKNDVSDLIGYLILTCVEKGWTDFSEFKD